MSQPETAKVMMVVVPVELLQRCLSELHGDRSTIDAAELPLTAARLDFLIADLKDALAVEEPRP